MGAFAELSSEEVTALSHLGQPGWADRFGERPRLLLGWVALALGAGLVTGVATAALSPLYAVAAALGLLAAAALLASTQAGLLAFVVVVALLPFAVVPLQLGLVKLTLLDFVLVALLLVWLGRLLTSPGERLRAGSLGGLVLAFIVLALVSFAAGTAYAITAETTRLFLKIVNSVLLYFTVLNCVRARRQLEQLVAALVIAGAAAAALGLVLYFLPAATATALLSSLRPLGYPGGDVLRYIADTTVQRAIGTAIDPNILGALLMLAAAVAVGQAVSPRPVLDRRLILSLLVPLIAGLLLTYSRSSWMGLAAAAMFVGTLRYRRLWLAFLLVAVALYLGILPQGEGFVGHLQSGLEARDQASAMRLGEYRDALRLIGQYPWFGVGFGVAPDVDLYIGVSSIYLLLAEQMGLVGLAAYLLAVGTVLWRALRVLLAERPEPDVDALLLGTTAAFVAALTAGVFDHHFVNLRFPHVVGLFWLLAGLTMVGVRLARQGHDTGAKDEVT